MQLASSERGATRKALPALERILSGPTEIDYFRADVLLAIFEIAPARAQELASTVVPSQVRERFPILPIMIQAIQAGKRINLSVEDARGRTQVDSFCEGRNAIYEIACDLFIFASCDFLPNCDRTAGGTDRVWNLPSLDALWALLRN